MKLGDSTISDNSYKYCFTIMDYCSILTPFLLKSLLILSTVNSRLANTPIIRTAAKSQAKINYRCLTEKQLPL